MEITKREIGASVTIVAVMMIIGFLVAGRIEAWQIKKNAEYYTALQITSPEQFQYGMDTSVGNAFVYGVLRAVDPVTYPEIGGEYMYIEKVKELYNMHTETYITTDDKGNAQVNTRTYWSWDYAGSEDMRCQEISFCGVNFASNKIDLPDADHIATIKESSNERYKYYGVGAECKGTIFTDLRDKTIPNNTSFYNNLTIDETIERLESDFPIIIFWIFWVVLIGGMVFGFYYLDNEWLK